MEEMDQGVPICSSVFSPLSAFCVVSLLPKGAYDWGSLIPVSFQYTGVFFQFLIGWGFEGLSFKRVQGGTDEPYTAKASSSQEPHYSRNFKI